MVSQPTPLDRMPNLFVKTEAILSFNLWRFDALQPLVTPTKPISDQLETFGVDKDLTLGSQTWSQTKSFQPKVQKEEQGGSATIQSEVSVVEQQQQQMICSRLS